MNLYTFHQRLATVWCPKNITEISLTFKMTRQTMRKHETLNTRDALRTVQIKDASDGKPNINKQLSCRDPAEECSCTKYSDNN